MVWRIDDPQGNEAAKVKHEVVRYTRGKVLDLGCGPSKAFPHFVGVDSGKDTELFGIDMKPDVVIPDCTDLSHFESGIADAIFSSHLLEHIPDYRAALAEWWRVLRVGGHLCLYLPHRDLYPNVGTHGANPDHKHDFVPANIIDALVMAGAMFELQVNETRSEGLEYSFLLVLRKTEDTLICVPPEKPAKSVCVVRYGGFGDMLQAANILPELKRQGFHVTVMTVPAGEEVLRHDPHVDEFFIQDRDQVPNEELTAFWAAQAKHFDKFINLSESVEGTFLAYVGRANHSWPHSVRHVMLNRNYLEFTAMLAELPYMSESRFYATDEERAAVARFFSRARIRAAGHSTDAVLAAPVNIPATFNVVWALAGSSPHKFYPHQDEVIDQILRTHKDVTITLVGDAACQLLEQGWENNPRVLCMSGKLGIRETLALAQGADCVIGPETGVLNAVAFEDKVGKVLLLSHSSIENLSKHWKRCVSVVPVRTACYPCHQLHVGREYCPEHEPTGAALCQWNLPHLEVYWGFEQHYGAWHIARAERAKVKELA
jgi:ADP-heptose:LPS heptosyltransferase/predicted SAM-dependent methyltransferase